MMGLTPGANTTLDTAQCSWRLTFGNAAAFADYAAVALLPVDDRRQPKGDAARFQLAQPWMQWESGQDAIACRLDLDQLPPGTDRVLAVLYVFSAAGPLSELRSLRLQVDAHIEFSLSLADHGEASMIIGEFYRRDRQWKFRAMAEGSAYGLAALGRRLGVELDEAHPHKRPPSTKGRPGNVTGTGFAVSTSHVLTCAHVVADMQEIHIASFEGRHRAEAVVVDERNDLALLRVQGAPAFQPVSFRDGTGCDLGENVVALGFPLAGLAGGGVHVTQGGVSALFGLHNDASLLQFTAPIQPGSSGSPLFDASGVVVGMVTSTVPDAQNMNFAVKSTLALAFLDACGVGASRGPTNRMFTTAQMAREAQPALWRIEARNP